MGLGDNEHRPRSNKSSPGLRPLSGIAGRKLTELPQQEASLARGGRRLEDLNTFESFLHKLHDTQFETFLHKLRDENEEHVAEEDWLAIDDLCQRFQLRRLVDGAAEHLQASSELSRTLQAPVPPGMLPLAAERLSRRQQNVDARGQQLVLSGQAMNCLGRRRPANMCDVAWRKDGAEGAATPGAFRDAKENMAGKRRCRSRCGNRARGIPSPQSKGNTQSQRVVPTYVGRDPSKPLSEGPVDEIAAKMGVEIVDFVKPARTQSLEKNPAADGLMKKIFSPHAKRCLVGLSEAESKVPVTAGYNREEEKHLMSPDSLGLWAIQSPTLDIGSDELLMESSISRSVLREHNFQGAPPPPSPSTRPGSSPSMVHGRPPHLGRAHSTPLLAADAQGALNYLDICHRVGTGHDAPPETTPPLADTAEVSDWTATPVTRTLVTGPMDPQEMLPESVIIPSTRDPRQRAATPDSVRTFSAVGSRPGTTGSSRAGAAYSCRSAGRRGMPLGAHTAPIPAGGGTAHTDNLFGVVSRSRNFSQGSPTELGPALASPVPQAQPARSKSSTIVRSSSAAASLRMPGSTWVGENPPRGNRTRMLSGHRIGADE